MGTPWWKFWNRTDESLVDGPPPARAIDPFDGYDPTQRRLDSGGSNPAGDPDVAVGLAMQAHNDAADAFERGRITLDDVGEMRQSLFDGYVNNMTGLGDWLRDKSLGGSPLGPEFQVRVISGAEVEDRWRGTDLGHRIVETIPTEMTRRGWRVQIQPGKDEDEARTDARAALRRLHTRAVARGDSRKAGQIRQAYDELFGPPTPTHTPGPLPEVDEDGTQVTEWLQTRCDEIHARQTIVEALNYQRAYGGGAVLLDVDDGENDLTRPLDWSRVRRIRGLVPYRGGWDGELIAWRYQNDMARAHFGVPVVYMLRNLGVPISSPPAPGERFMAPQRVPSGPTGPLIRFVHASRLMVFPGRQISRRVRVILRGWSDSVFTRVDEVLAQYGQTWSGLAILLQEASLKVVKIQDAATLFASGKPADREKLKNRAIAMQMLESIAKVKFIDSKEEFQRVEVGTLAGIADVLREMALRISAASEIPLSRLMGQTQGGLGDASKGDQRDFYDNIEGRQVDELKPQIYRLHRGLMLAGDSPTGGKLPERWSVVMNPLQQMNDKEKAEYRKLIGETDKLYVDMGGATPEEVIGTRFGGSDFNDGPIVIDIEARRAMKEADRPPEALGAPPAQLALPPGPGAPPAQQPPGDPQPAPDDPPAPPGAPPPREP